MLVRIVERQRGAETVVAVESLRTQQTQWACVGIGERGAAYAVVAAVQWCAAHRWPIVTVTGDVAGLVEAVA